MTLKFARSKIKSTYIYCICAAITFVTIVSLIAVLVQFKKKYKSEDKVPSPPPTDNQKEGLLESIRKGVNLKKVEEEVKKYTKTSVFTSGQLVQEGNQTTEYSFHQIWDSLDSSDNNEGQDLAGESNEKELSGGILNTPPPITSTSVNQQSMTQEDSFSGSSSDGNNLTEEQMWETSSQTSSGMNGGKENGVSSGHHVDNQVKKNQSTVSELPEHPPQKKSYGRGNW